MCDASYYDISRKLSAIENYSFIAIFRNVWHIRFHNIPRKLSTTENYSFIAILKITKKKTQKYLSSAV